MEDLADLGNELRLRNALQRRGLACEIAGIMSFSVHEKILNEYFTALQEEPAKDYCKVTIDQIYVLGNQFITYSFGQLGDGRHGCFPSCC